MTQLHKLIHRPCYERLHGGTISLLSSTPYRHTEGSMHLFTDDERLMLLTLWDVNIIAILLGCAVTSATLAGLVSFVSKPLIHEWMHASFCVLLQTENSSHVSLYNKVCGLSWVTDSWFFFFFFNLSSSSFIFKRRQTSSNQCLIMEISIKSYTRKYLKLLSIL